jgi:S-adenosylmethionine:tRNA ribosyltransferase-isomerase
MPEPSPVPIENYNYELRGESIARYPLSDRSASKLLLYRGGRIS